MPILKPDRISTLGSPETNPSSGAYRKPLITACASRDAPALVCAFFASFLQPPSIGSGMDVKTCDALLMGGLIFPRSAECQAYP